MDFTISSYLPSEQIAVKEFILHNFKEFGFSYNPQYDSDLDNPNIYITNGGILYLLKNKTKIIGTVAIIN